MDSGFDPLAYLRSPEVAANPETQKSNLSNKVGEAFGRFFTHLSDLTQIPQKIAHWAKETFPMLTSAKTSETLSNIRAIGQDLDQLQAEINQLSDDVITSQPEELADIKNQYRFNTQLNDVLDRLETLKKQTEELPPSKQLYTTEFSNRLTQLSNRYGEIFDFISSANTSQVVNTPQSMLEELPEQSLDEMHTFTKEEANELNVDLKTFIQQEIPATTSHSFSKSSVLPKSIQNMFEWTKTQLQKLSEPPAVKSHVLIGSISRGLDQLQFDINELSDQVITDENPSYIKTNYQLQQLHKRLDDFRNDVSQIKAKNQQHITEFSNRITQLANRLDEAAGYIAPLKLASETNALQNEVRIEIEFEERFDLQELPIMTLLTKPSGETQRAQEISTKRFVRSPD